MRPPCELVTKYVLPAVRSLIVRELVDRYGFSQVVAAKMLGITQATISHYLYSKRGEKYLEKMSSNEDIMRMAKELADGIANKSISDVELMTRLCDICLSIRSKRLLCDIHRELNTISDSCDLCMDV